MKVLVINGSPKKKSDTMHLTTAFLEGLNKDNEYQIKIINLIEKEIHPCLGCYQCWKTNDGKCFQNDDGNSILSDIIESDLIIYSFPLYCYSFPSHLKALIDRLLPLTKMEMKKVGNTVRHSTIHDLSNKHYLVISGCGFPAWDGNFNSLDIQCHNLFPHNLTCVYVPETPMLNVEIAKPVVLPLLEKFKNAGTEYSSTLNLSESTILELETPMIPQETYMQIVNGN